MTYKFCGNLATGATLELADGVQKEVMLYPGRSYELPEGHPWVQRMVKRGFLAAVPGPKTKPAKTKAAPEPAKETV